MIRITMNTMKTIGIIGLIVLSSIQVWSQDELVVPFSEPGKRGKVKVDLRRGSIKVVGTARKDVLVKYQPVGSKTEY